MGASDREYEFFVTTDEPQQPDGVERGRIRRLVMHNFFEMKEAGPQCTSAHNSASTVQAKTELKGRFRLSKVGQTRLQTRSKRGNTKEELNRNRSKVKRTLSNEIHPSATTECGTSCTGGVNEIPLKTDQLMVQSVRERQDKRIVLRINPGSYRFDPFDVLPVPGSPRLDLLFKLYKTGSKTNSIAVNAKRTWWPFISNDAGLLHATLATWALYGILVQGLSELRVDKLRHKNEAIMRVNMKIRVPNYKISDELIGTILTIANFENLLGAYETAQLHVAALKRMVGARGGLPAFEHNDGLIRGIIWVDFHAATIFRTQPSFPQMCLSTNTPPLPDGLLEEAACTSPTSPLQLSIAAIDCFNIFYRLHRLALAACTQWRDGVDRLALSELLYESEYIILSVPDRSRDFLDFDFESDQERTEDYAAGEKVANAASIVEGLLAASQIFIYAALRDIPIQARIFSILLERLYTAIARPPVLIIAVWKEERNLNMLLWSLIVACSVVKPGVERVRWIRFLGEVMIELEIKSLFDLETALQRITWVDYYFGNVLRRIWEEVWSEES
ncbi:hypothetical protein GQ44DRAFT_828094 [Phaeosphaeriaceae sp. PMI808]|nr:hypothetical protein GQ44DRAFT_828094 [Phaeosphaeriaceae sp. PMI808]